MGIPRFFQWLSERYPLISEAVSTTHRILFDRLYVDMNGLIHHCSHGGTPVLDEQDIWIRIFQHISHIVEIVRPRQLLYLAVDGVAPMAKMSEQRVRRFRSAISNTKTAGLKAGLEGGLEGGLEAALAADMASKGTAATEGAVDAKSASGKKTESKAFAFDANCITSGTMFMSRLTRMMEFFIQQKLSEDPLWADLEVIFSSSNVPGEGEHKIMECIRTADPSGSRHCVYGLDEDLIMLCLATHERFISLLRPQVRLDVSSDYPPVTDGYSFLHLGLLRQYMEVDFGISWGPDNAGALGGEEFPFFDGGVVWGMGKLPKDALPESVRRVWDVERYIDDFILICFLGGNDFLPHLPFADIGKGGVQSLVSAYRSYLDASTKKRLESASSLGTRSNSSWLTHSNGVISWSNFFEFLKVCATVEVREIEKRFTEFSDFTKKETQVSPMTSDPPASAAGSRAQLW